MHRLREWSNIDIIHTAVNVQNSWAVGLGTNLMVSGYHWPERTKLGSGIYRGYSDQAYEYTFDADSGNVMVVSPVESCRTGQVTRKTQVIIDEPEIIQVVR